MAVTLRKPCRFPPIRFIREIVLGMRAPISSLPCPAKGLIEALALDFYRARGEDKRGLEFYETGDHGVMGGQGRSPHSGINGPGAVTHSHHPPCSDATIS
jgi:hypothetical protein